ncbi:MAG TPA: META domain-containing protein [Usitatibacter sp.]|nr:META domain-containing protein [Usitatibacter sp.]
MTVAPRHWVVGLLLLGACTAAPVAPPGRAGSGPPADPSLAGTRWVGVVEGVTDGRTLPRLELAEGGRLTGYTGCNMMSGTWRREGSVVRLGAIAATKRMCLGPGAEIEKRLLAALGEDSRLAREGSRLVLTGPSGARFEFIPAASA